MSLFSKRVADILLSGFALFLLVPCMVAIALAVRLSVGHPILFRQTRAGFRGKPFTLLKFRTMTAEQDTRGLPLPDAERLTLIGKFLRHSSLDELPQLWNVFRGDMSVVGPRPLLMEYMDRYTPEQSRRHNVKPGMTGWAQVNGRNALSWERKFTLDLWYVDNWCHSLDFRILFHTVWQVLSRGEISFDGCATMPEFTGRQDREVCGPSQ